MKYRIITTDPSKDPVEYFLSINLATLEDAEMIGNATLKAQQQVEGFKVSVIEMDDKQEIPEQACIISKETANKLMEIYSVVATMTSVREEKVSFPETNVSLFNKYKQKQQIVEVTPEDDLTQRLSSLSCSIQ